MTKSDVEDWKKLKRGLTFIKNTIDEKRIIGANNLTDIYTWIDSAHDVYPNMRGNTGGTILMGYGIVHGKGAKQKINVKSSTESEVVVFSEYVPYNLWMLMFMEEQGYKIKNNVIYQDYESTIRMF